MMGKPVVVLSGGMDSTTALYWALEEFGDAEAISFNYGQRHKVELEYAQCTTVQLQVDHHIVDLSSVQQLIASSALTDPSSDVPEGHYEDETMKQTVVPNRNAMMLNIAIARAVAIKSTAVVTGIHAGDHAVYPDCRPEFVFALNQLVQVACEGFAQDNLRVLAPFVTSTKAQIAATGDQLGVNWENTWSCYKGGEAHCGRCSTCLERIEAFSIADVADPTTYKDLSLYYELHNKGALG
jgi:7-cyano-7-deazaguanine synthase